MNFARTISFAICVCLTLSSALGKDLQSLYGQWSGAIQIPSQPLRLVVRFAATGHTVDIPQQGAVGLALDDVALDADKVRFAMKGVPGQPIFDGTLKGDVIAGKFTQGGASFPFELKRGEAAQTGRPQDPRPPLPYLEEEVTARNGDAVLSATLTRPKEGGKDGRFPAVILISGSGPQNRDSEVFDHRPFRVLADALTRAGVMVVRFDDRGVGKSTGSSSTATIETTSHDAGAFVDVLKARKDVSVIGVIGHSEGGRAAPMLAARNADIGFVVMLAGPGVRGDEVMVEQNRALILASGGTPEQADRVAAAAAEVFKAALADGSEADLIAKVRKLTEAQVDGPLTAQIEAGLVGAAKQLRAPWFQDFLKSDPGPDLKKLRVPVLALNGSKDTQVISSQNLPAIRRHLEAGGNKDATVKEMAGLNHLFQTAGTGGVSEYGQLEETMSPATLELIGSWIRERFIEPRK